MEHSNIQQLQTQLLHAQQKITQLESELESCNRIIVELTNRVNEQKQLEQALELTEKQFQTIYETAPIGMATADRYGNYLKTNFAFQQIFGYTEEELQSMNVADLMKTSYIDKTTQVKREKLRGSTILHIEQRYQHKDGSFIWCHSTTFDVRDKDGQLQYVMYLVMDITERKLVEDQQKLAFQTLEQQVEERTREIEGRRRVADSLRDILTILNSDKSLDFMLNKIVKQGIQLLQMSGVAICSITQPSEITLRAYERIDRMIIESTNRKIASPQVFQKLMGNELITLNTDDREDTTSALILIVPMKIEGKVDGCVQLYYQDRTELNSEEKSIALTYVNQIALAIINSTLREQIKQASAIEERNRLARDLHDAVSQTLWSASLIAEILPNIWEQDVNKGRDKLNQLKQLNMGALTEMRSLLMELRPQALEDLPLEQTLTSLITSTENRTGIAMTYNIQSDNNIPTDIKVTFYRIVQESLNNIAKHANATHIDITLVGDQNQMELTIVDNGIGFNPDDISSEHFGVSIMHERARDINAELTITSSNNQGTTLKLEWAKIWRTV